MFDKKKITSWWRLQSATIKAAIIAGFFGLLVAFCGCTGTVVTLFANYYLSQLSTKPVNSMTYPLHRNNLYTTTSILFTEMYGENFSGAVPTTCVRADYGDTSIQQLDENSVLKEAQRQEFAFDLVTEQPLIISDAEVILQKYMSPPSAGDIKSITFYDPPGMGSVPPVYFAETSINKSSKKLIITRKEGSLRLDPGDAVTLVVPLVFFDPGLYSLQFIIQGQLNLGGEADFTSDTYSYGWMYINNITSLPIKTWSGTKIKWLGTCP